MSRASEARKIVEDVPLFPYDRYEAQIDELARSYQGKSPVPHQYFVNFLDDAVARAMEAEFPAHEDESWIQYKHINEKKAGLHLRDHLPSLIGRVVDELNSPRFVELLCRITGIPDLLADPMIEGGGMHQATRGGFLNVHTDFTMHRRIPNWRRRCNLILYLNDGWDTAWGGCIDFWSNDMQTKLASYPPMLNSAVLFNTPGALHGFPDALTCPENVARKSVQFYYYTADATPETVPHSTTYHAVPSDSRMKRFLIWLDNEMLKAYAWMKRRLGLSDHAVSWVLGKLGGRKK